MYDPTLGRFIQRDPINFMGEDVNLYSYVYDQPIYGMDPYGTDIYVFIDPSRARENDNAYDRISKEAEAWNNCIDRLLKDFGDPNKKPNLKLKIGEKEVSQQELIDYLNSNRMHVEKLAKADTAADAMKKLNEILANKTEKDQILLESHSTNGIGINKDIAQTINVGGKALEIDYFMKMIGPTKAKFVVGSCFWSEELAKQLAQKMKTEVGATSGKEHTSFGKCGYRTENDPKTKKPVAFQFELKTPFATAGFRKSPSAE